MPRCHPPLMANILQQVSGFVKPCNGRGRGWNGRVVLHGGVMEVGAV